MKKKEQRRQERIHRIAFEAGERVREASDMLRLVSLAVESESFNHCQRDGEVAALRLIDVDVELGKLASAVKELARLGLSVQDNQ